MKPKVGDWGWCIGNNGICEEIWKASFPNNWFGRVIEIKKDRLSNHYLLRCYTKDGRKHLKCSPKYFKAK